MNLPSCPDSNQPSLTPKSSKLSCRVNRQYPGLIHLFEHQVTPPDAVSGSPGFSVWYGVVDVACSGDEAYKAFNSLYVWIALEDGRVGTARQSEYHIRGEQDVDSAVGMEWHITLTVIGLSPLVDVSRENPRFGILGEPTTKAEPNI